MSQRTTIAITMAGFGSRFSEAGYTVPKYMIEAKGATLFEWSLRGLDRFILSGSRFVFVVRTADEAEKFIRERAAALGIAEFEIISLDKPTDGQATTAHIAASHSHGEAPFAIFNIDTGLAPGLFGPEDVQGAGWIPCFNAPGAAWSFVRVDSAGRALEVREKVRISDHATIGFYWFASADLYRTTYKSYYATVGREERGERYVAPMYNQLITEGQSVYTSSIPLSAVTPLGTPAELHAFLESGGNYTEQNT
jgi:dTDP-glucose pyrophosphorylase